MHGGYGSARPKYSHSRDHSDKLQIVDLLYLWQLTYVRINQAMCSPILFNSPGFQFYFDFTVYEQVRKNNVNNS